jgi:hypothetical protein
LSPKVSWWLSWVIGALLVLGHVWALPRILASFQKPSLSVEVSLPSLVPEGSLEINAKIPPAINPIFLVDNTPQKKSPFLKSGMRHLSWKVLYRGGFVREVGTTLLVGEPQKPDDPPCGARVVIHQKLLDDGTSNPKTFANVLREMANSQMQGMSVPVLGALQEIRSVRIWWSAKTDKDPKALRILMEAAFEKGVVPLSFWLMPHIENGELILSRYASARVEGAGWLEKAAAFIVRGDSFATNIAQEQIDIAGNMVEEMLRKPPPFPLWDDTAIQMVYCKGQDIEITEREAASIPLAVVLPKEATVPAITLSLPLQTPVLSSAPLSLDMNLETLNGVLHFLWVKGYFVKALQDLDAKNWLNGQAGKHQFLTLRLADIEVSLPPVLEVSTGDKPFWVGLEASLQLKDREKISEAKLFSRFSLGLGSTKEEAIDVDLSLEDEALTCEEKGVLLPCYADLFAELKKHTPEFEGPLKSFLGSYFTQLLTQLRLSDPSLPVSFEIEKRQVGAWRAGGSVGLRLELWGGLK